jgi:hypothetical protein
VNPAKRGVQDDAGAAMAGLEIEDVANSFKVCVSDPDEVSPK